MADRVREILSWYESDNAGTKANLARMLRHGKLAGTGKLVILPVDQGDVGAAMTEGVAKGHASETGAQHHPTDGTI